MRILIFALILALPATIIGAEQQHSRAGTADRLKLSPDLRQLLQQEMRQIRSGMEALAFAVPSADWTVIEDTGRAIQRGHIMDKRLNEEQKQDLHQALPEHFRQLDHKFHYYAGMLTHVASERDMELVNFYVYKMNESCVACHAQFAGERFTGFAAANKHDKRDQHDKHEDQH